MAAGQAFKYFIKIGKEYLRTNSKAVLDKYLKQGGKRIKKGDIPENAKVKNAPTTPNPRSGGKFTKPQPVTNPRTTTPTTRSSGSRPAPSTVSGSGTSPSRPKIDRTPANQTKTRAVSTKNNPNTRNTMKDITPPTRAISGSTPRQTPKSVARPNANTSAAGALRLSTNIGSAPEIDTKAPTPKTKPNNKSGEMPKKKVKVTPTNKSGESPKKKKSTTTRSSSPRPKLRPKTTTKSQPKRSTSPKPKTDPLKNWSDSRRKALGSDKIGKDAGDDMVWIVSNNSNALVRVKPNDPRVAEQKRLKKSL